MANPPRKSSSRRSQDPSKPMDDLFAGKLDPAATPAAPDDWTLEEPAPSPRSRGGALPVQPIPNTAPVEFESNPAMPAPSPDEEFLPDALPPPAPEAAESISQALPAPPPERAPVPAAPDDPFEIDEELPILPPRPAEPPAEPGPSGAGQANSEEPEEFSARDEDGAAPQESAAPTAPARRDVVGLASAAIVMLSLLGVFSAILYMNRPAAEGSGSQTAPLLPLAGQLVTLPEVTSGWRSRQPGDLVSMVDVSLPSPSRQQPAFVPEVRFSVDPAATKAGFLRFIFLDPDGKISGDVRVVKVNGNAIDPMASGASVTASGTTAVYGSLGFMDRAGFVSYASSISPRWSVEVSESIDYNAKEAGWTKLQTFDIRNTTAP